MTAAQAAAPRWQRLRSFVAQSLGLDFPREAQLRRLFGSAATELGFSDAAACADWLLATPLSPAVVQVLARHLTVGETYFFRDRAALDALERGVLPALLQQRRTGQRRLRVWCAACCTGEEPYTVAILLHRLLPDLARWDVSILGTDINAAFIEKAEAGVYGEWSFRNVPLPVRARYFESAGAGRYRIVPEIRRMVTFRVANLVGAPGAPGMDLVLCRNVLMYFDAKRIDQVSRQLASCLVAGGHLVVGPGETPSIDRTDLVAVHHPGAVLLRKVDAAPRRGRAAWPQPALVPVPTTHTAPAVVRDLPQAATPAVPVDSTVALARRARELADTSRLEEALACCDRWLGIDKLDATGHYTRGMILQELDRLGESQVALQRALYIQGDFVMAHVALGQLAHRRGDALSARRHFANAERLLRQRDPGEPLPEGDSLTGGQMLQTLPMLARAEGGA